MSQMDVTTIPVPPGALGFNYAIIDQVGVATANTYLSLFNPVGSGKTVAWLAASIHRYTTGTSTTAASLAIYRTTAASGGTLVPAANITDFDTSQPNSIMQVRFGSPTVTLLSPVPVFSASPPLGNGPANASPSETTTPGGVLALSHPGEGLAFQTASGNINQVWSFQISWAEF